MIVNNLEKLTNFLTTPKDGLFYVIEVIKFQKDNPEMTSKKEIIDRFHIYEPEDITRYYNKIKLICDNTRSRAYIRYNIKDSKRVAYNMIRAISDVLEAGEYMRLPSLFESMAGQQSVRQHRYWLIDIDTKDELLVNDIKNTFTALSNSHSCIVPSVNGYHLLVKPFNKLNIPDKYREIDIHDNSMIILYSNV